MDKKIIYLKSTLVSIAVLAVSILIFSNTIGSYEQEEFKKIQAQCNQAEEISTDIFDCQVTYQPSIIGIVMITLPPLLVFFSILKKLESDQMNKWEKYR